MSVRECEEVLELLTEHENIEPEAFVEISKLIHQHSITSEALCEAIPNFVSVDITEVRRPSLRTSVHTMRSARLQSLHCCSSELDDSTTDYRTDL